MEGVFGETAISFLSPRRTEDREGALGASALRDGGGRGCGQEREGIKGVRFPLLPRAGVEQGGLATRISGGSARRL